MFGDDTGMIIDRETCTDPDSHGTRRLRRCNAHVFPPKDALISEYSPNSEGHKASAYMPFIGITSKFVSAARVAKAGYFIMIDGIYRSPYLNCRAVSPLCRGSGGISAGHNNS